MTMSTWLYLQAFVDLALGVGFVLLLAGRRRARAADQWQREVASLVDTLGELMVEVERMTAAPAPASPAGPPEPTPDTAPVAVSAAAPVPDEITVTFAPAPPEAASVPPPAAAPASRPAPTPLVDAVLAFARQGLSAEDIARRVGRPVGEVALTLGLRGPRPAAAEG